MSTLRPFWLALLITVVPVLPGAEAPVYPRGSGPELERNLPDGFRRLQLGEAAPDFNLIGVDDRHYQLSDFAGHKYLLVVFLSNHCPYSHAAESRMIPWINAMKARGLGVVAIQPNHPDAVTVDELGYSKYNDSFEEMKLYAAENHFTFPYLYDGETQAVAQAYGALATPDLFLFDEQRRLRYSGRFDDSRFEEADTVKSHDAIRAFDDLLAGRPVAVATTRPMGCAVKWLTKLDKAKAANQAAWEHEPVTLEPIDAAGVAALTRNPTKKYRLINVWATWCAPCVEEFPELVKFSRRLKRRDFEVITISMDHPREQAKALRFLQAQHAGMPARIKASLEAEGRSTNNYLYTQASTDALVQALDPEWPGPLPHTVLIAPGGEIVWRFNGPFDPVVLGRTILDHLGGFYPQE
jgi:peroxiredoxin